MAVALPAAAARARVLLHSIAAAMRPCAAHALAGMQRTGFAPPACGAVWGCAAAHAVAAVLLLLRLLALLCGAALQPSLRLVAPHSPAAWGRLLPAGDIDHPDCFFCAFVLMTITLLLVCRGGCGRRVRGACGLLYASLRVAF